MYSENTFATHDRPVVALSTLWKCDIVLSVSAKYSNYINLRMVSILHNIVITNNSISTKYY